MSATKNSLQTKDNKNKTEVMCRCHLPENKCSDTGGHHDETETLYAHVIGRPKNDQYKCGKCKIAADTAGANGKV